MSTLKEAADRFLSLKIIAVAGVSSTKKNPANYIYQKLKDAGNDVFAINPRATMAEGDKCYKSLSDLPKKPDGVVIGTRPEVTLSIVEECSKLGIRNVWIHKSVDNGSYSPEAEKYYRENGITVIPGGCPMMFGEQVDFPHKCIKWALGLMGKLPKEI